MVEPITPRVDHLGGDAELRQPAHQARRVRVLPADADADRGRGAEHGDAQHALVLLERHERAAEAGRVDPLVLGPGDARARARLPHLLRIEHVHAVRRAQLDVVRAAPHDRAQAGGRVREARHAQRDLAHAQQQHAGTQGRQQAWKEARHGHRPRW
jgi:hypothetical protein